MITHKDGHSTFGYDHNAPPELLFQQYRRCLNLLECPLEAQRHLAFVLAFELKKVILGQRSLNEPAPGLLLTTRATASKYRVKTSPESVLGARCILQRKRPSDAPIQGIVQS